jgi:hypothetical protein
MSSKNTTNKKTKTDRHGLLDKMSKGFGQTELEELAKRFGTPEPPIFGYILTYETNQ